MKRTLILLLALSIGFNLGFVVRALREPSPPPIPAAPPQPPLDEILDQHLAGMDEELRLTSRQRTTIQAIHDTLRPTVQEAHAALEAAQTGAAGSFREAIDAPDRFREGIETLHRARARLDSVLTDILLSELSVLDADQRTSYIDASPWSHQLGGRPPRRP